MPKGKKHLFKPADWLKRSGISATLILMLLITQCGRDSSQSFTFKAEKMFHAAEKLSQTSAIGAGQIDTLTRTRIKNGYYGVMNYCWAHIDSISREKQPEERRDIETVAYLAVSRLSQIFLTESKNDSIIIINRQLQNFATLESTPLLNSRLFVARAYQAEGNILEAMSIYRTLIDSFYPPVENDNRILYPVINLPRQMVSMFFLLDDEAAAAAEVESAEGYYRRLIDEWPNSALESAARSNLARLYYDTRQWDKAIENLAQLKDSTGRIDVESELIIAGITATGKQEYRKAIELYDNLSSRTEDSATQALINMRKGIVYYRNGNYELCRKTMSELSDNYPRFYQRNPLPQKYLALSFEKLNDWGRAENEFRWLIDNYPRSEAAFDAFLAIATYYEKANNEKFMLDWYQRAEQFYNSMAEQYKGSNIEASALSYLAEVAKRRDNWDLAAKYLVSIFDKFPQTDMGKRSLVNAALIYREKLAQTDKADSLISKLRKELYPVDGGKNIDVLSDDNN